MFRRKSVKVDRQQCASNTGQIGAVSATTLKSNDENNAPATTSNNLIPSSSSKIPNLASFKSPAIRIGTNGFRSPMVPVVPKLNTSTGTKRKSIFGSDLDDLEIDPSIKKKPFSSFSKILPDFDGSNYSIDFSVEPNEPTGGMATDFDPFDDKMINTAIEKPKYTNNKSSEKEVKKVSSTTAHENYDDLLNDSLEDFADMFDDDLADVPVEENSPESMPKNEGFRTAAGAVINISDEQRQQAMKRFEDLADLSKEVACFLWAYRRQVLE